MRVRGSDPDGLRVRQRVEAQLFAIGAGSLGLPPQALLFVRRVEARTDSHAPLSLRGDAALARTVNRQLMRLAQQARRPWTDATAAHADAVVFIDEAELIACFIRDRLRGLAGERWWWRNVLGSATAEEWLRQQVLPRGEALVPAVSLLESGQEVVRFIASLQPSDVRLTVAAVAHAFALPSVTTSAWGKLSATAGQEESAAEAPRRLEQFDDLGRAAVVRLLATVPEVQSPELAAEQRRLAIIVLVAARALAWARTPQFIAAVRLLERVDFDIGSLVTPPTAGRDAEPAPRRATNPRPAQRSPTRRLEHPARPHEGRRIEPLATAEAAPSPVPPTTEPLLTIEAQAGAGSTPATDRTEQEESDARREVSDAAAVREISDWPRSVDSDREPAGELESPAPAALAVDEWLLVTPTRRVDTEYGGMFYLLNAWLAMGVYSDFTAPRGPNLAVSPWDLLALTGRTWFGEPFARDPVCTLLADLAGRDADTESGLDVDRPAGWLDRHLEMLGDRLGSALPLTPLHELPAFVCGHRARVEAAAAWVHVHFSLSELPLDLRIAGLDRDPGWIPAAGRSIAFHFS